MPLSSRVSQYLSVQIGQGRACSWEIGGLIQIGHQLYPHHGISSQGTALCAGQTGWIGNLCGCSHLQLHTSNIITHIFLKILMTKTERSYKTLPWPLMPKNQTRRLVSAILPPTAGPALTVHLACHPYLSNGTNIYFPSPVSPRQISKAWEFLHALTQMPP